MDNIKIDILKNHPKAIPTLSKIWHEVLGKIWMPEVGIDEVESLFYEELNRDMPLTFVALDGEIPVGSCTLHSTDDVRPDFGPWIESLVVDAAHQNKGIGKMLLDFTVAKARELGFKSIYLFAFDPSLTQYYSRFGWEEIGVENFKSHQVRLMTLGLLMTTAGL